MENNYLFNMKLQEFAALSRCSLSTFKREFKNMYTTNPGKWLVKKRLEYAQNRLKNGTEPIKEIAYLAGFETSSYFIQAFEGIRAYP